MSYVHVVNHDIHDIICALYINSCYTYSASNLVMLLLSFLLMVNKI